MEREEKVKVQKSRKRIKIAILFVVTILLVSILGFLVRTYRRYDLSFFQQEKIVAPIAEKIPEQKLAEELKKVDFRVISLSIIGEKVIEASISGGTKIIFKTEEIEKQISSLQLILPRFKIEGRIPKKIDLRFEKPIVIF